MNLENYANLAIWVEELNSTIEDVLLERLKEAIVTWTTAFNSEEYPGEVYGHKGRKATFANIVDENTKTKQITMGAVLHELTIRNQVIFLEPPLDHARAICFSSLHDCLGTRILTSSLLFRDCVQSTLCASIPLRAISPSLIGESHGRRNLFNFGIIPLYFV
jgi:hypothetical protein